MRELIVVVLSIAVLSAMAVGLRALSKEIDLWLFMAICIGGTAVFLFIAWRQDRREAADALARQELLPPDPVSRETRSSRLGLRDTIELDATSVSDRPPPGQQALPDNRANRRSPAP